MCQAPVAHARHRSTSREIAILFCPFSMLPAGANLPDTVHDVFNTVALCCGVLVQDVLLVCVATRCMQTCRKCTGCWPCIFFKMLHIDWMPLCCTVWCVVHICLKLHQCAYFISLYGILTQIDHPLHMPHACQFTHLSHIARGTLVPSKMVGVIPWYSSKKLTKLKCMGYNGMLMHDVQHTSHHAYAHHQWWLLGASCA